MQFCEIYATIGTIGTIMIGGNGTNEVVVVVVVVLLARIMMYRG